MQPSFAESLLVDMVTDAVAHARAEQGKYGSAHLELVGVFEAHLRLLVPPIAAKTQPEQLLVAASGAVQCLRSMLADPGGFSFWMSHAEENMAALRTIVAGNGPVA